MEPRFSMRLVRPFLKHMADSGVEGRICSFASWSVDARIPVRVALAWIESAVESSGDPDLGLRAVKRIEHGGYDLVEYAARSCSTWGDALEIVLRYVHLLNEAADYALHVGAGSARLELHSKVPLNRAAADFTVCGLVSAATRWTRTGSLSGCELWFRHPKPSCTRAYEGLLGPVVLRFDAPFEALIFDEEQLAAPLRTADPNLNALLRRHADQALSSCLERRWVTGRVRELLMELLPAGVAQGERVARRLGMSRRTLSRQL